MKSLSAERSDNKTKFLALMVGILLGGSVKQFSLHTFYIGFIVAAFLGGVFCGEFLR